MRHDPASAAVVVMLRSLKMYGMAQAVDELIEQGAPAFDAAVPILSQLDTLIYLFFWRRLGREAGRYEQAARDFPHFASVGRALRRYQGRSREYHAVLGRVSQ